MRGWHRSSESQGDKEFSWERPPPRDPYLHLKIRRSTLYAALASLLLHLAVLFVVPHQPMGSNAAATRRSEMLVARLRTDKPVQAPAAASPPAHLPRSANRRKPVSKPPVLARNKPDTQQRAAPTVAANPPTPTPSMAEPATDMQSYLEAARARRRASQGYSEREIAAAAALDGLDGLDRQPSEEERRMAQIKRNLMPGTSGVFQILSMDSRTAAFSFRGWTVDASNARREYIAVEIGTNANIEIAIVRRMIELIRRYYKGNFNWESQRLDRTMVLSARLEDNDGLEEFMMKEFFRTPPPTGRFR